MKPLIFRSLAFGEKLFSWSQGRGYGSATLKKEVAAALPFVRNDAVVFDVGANHGKWAQEMLARSGTRIRTLYAFEPSKHNDSKIISLDDGRIVLVPKAVSNQAGSATLHYDEAGSGLASLTLRRLDFRGLTMTMAEPVETTTLDAFIAEQGIEKVDFAKFDIEGHELDALRGAEKALTNHIIGALAFEFGGCNIDTRTYFRDFWYFLTERGYKLARINPFFTPMPIRNYSEALEDFRITNIIASL